MGYSEFEFDDYDPNKNEDYARPTFLQNMVMNFGECGFRCIKITFFIYNLAFWIVGFIILFFAIMLHTTRNETTSMYTELSGLQGYMNGPLMLLVIGLFTLFLSFLACCGSHKNSIPMLSIYSALLFLITAGEFGIIVLAYLHRNQIDNSLKVDFQKTLNQYSLPHNEKITQSIDALQRDFKCCGYDGYADWLDTKWGQQNGNYSVPQSCCVIQRMKNCNRDVDSKLETIFTGGCYEHVKNYLFENLHVVSGFAIWIVVLEILGIIFALALIIKIRKENRLLKGMGDEIYNRTSDTMDY